jgi:hypothetical protein
MKTKPSFYVLLALFAAVLLAVADAKAQTVFTLSPLTSFGTRSDGSIQPTDVSWVDSNTNQRGLAYDPITGNLVFVDTHSGSGGSTNVLGNVFILDGTTGANLTTLNTNGMGGGSYSDASAGVADDGAVYVANLVNSSTGSPFIIYRWNSTLSTNPPSICFSNFIAPAQRYGASLDVRGAGTNTQIIIGSSPQSGGSGTSVVIFTTADGTNFAANVLATDATSANFTDGIAFGSSNTFWAKRIGSPLRLMSFNLITATAVTVQSFDSTILPAADNLGPIAVDNANKLLAAIEVITGGSEHVRLYDISNSNRAPVLLDIKDYTPSFGNASAPPGYLDFGGGRLYSHVINNGLLSFSVGSGSPASPVIVTQPIASKRLVVGQTATLSVLAYPSLSYQWQLNSVNVPGATNAVLNLTNVQTINSGTYTVVVTNSAGTLTSSDSQLIVVNPQDLFHLNSLWSVSASAGASYFNSSGGNNTPNQRTIAYNALSNQLYVVSRAGSASLNFTINVLEATNTTLTASQRLLYTLKTNGISGGAIGLVAIAAAADGAIYACNMDTSAATGVAAVKLYRWADSGSNTLPTLVFTGEPAAQSSTFRWGDVMDVRGTGTNTQILLDNVRSTAATPSQRYLAILSPTDAFMTNFAAQHFTFGLGQSILTTIGRGLQYGVGDTVWQKGFNGPVVNSSFDLTQAPNGISVLNTYSNFNNFSVLGAAGFDFTHNLMGVIHTNITDTLDLYDISDLTAPLLLAQYNFPIAHGANANNIGQVLFVGNNVFVIGGNNGVMAFSIASGPLTPPSFVSQPQNQRVILGGTVALSATTSDLSTFQWQFSGANIAGATSSSYSLSNAQLANGGSYRVIASNSSGSTTSSVAQVTLSLPTDNYSLSQVWSTVVGANANLTFNPDGNTPFNRSLAYYGPSNQLYVINRTGAAAGLSVNVFDASTGSFLYPLNTSGISTVAGANLILVMIATSPDGSIYAANASVTSGSTTATYNLYRWANSNPSTVPVLVFSAEPANQTATFRWGDSLDVRGTGTATQVIIDEGNSANLASILVPTDATLTTFTNFMFAQSYGPGPIGRSLQFGSTNSFWQKRKGLALTLSAYNTNSQTSTVLASYTKFAAALGGFTQDFTRHLGVGVEFSATTNAPDMVDLYETSDLNTPLLIARYNFPTNQQGNGNFLSQCVFADNRVYALDANNGIVAFNLVPPPTPQLSIVSSGASAVITWPTNFTGYTLESTPALVAGSNVWTAVGTGTLVGTQYAVTNSASGTSKFYRLRK